MIILVLIKYQISFKFNMKNDVYCSYLSLM